MFLSNCKFFVSVFCFVVLFEFLLPAQTRFCSSANQGSSSVSKSDRVEYPAEHYLLRNILCDQANIWTSPLRLRLRDMKFLVPFAGITTGLILTDRASSFEMTRGTHISSSKHISDAGVALAGVAVVGSYGLGRLHADDHLRETGVLAGEAVLDSVVIDEALKYGFRRERPFEGDKKGHFFRSGQSFPSEHAGVTWAAATVFANEYPGWFTKTLAYGTASAVSLARVGGQQHYLSDVFVGGALGYLTGKYVYKAHHNEELGGEDYGTFAHERNPLSPHNMGSAYVPLDSWIYPAVERLAALGAIHGDFLGLRPWTRISVAEMLDEAGDQLSDDESQSAEIQNLYQSLKAEFADELQLQPGDANQSIRVESLYTRSMYISGRPLNDSYHFGQTIINDFGRPYQQGYNQVSGFSARAENGRFFFYARGEYQRAPGAAAYPLNVRQAIAYVDRNPLQPATPFAEQNQFRLLDTYVGMTLLGNQISIGKQGLWWGPDHGGALLMSDNAEPFYMLRITRAVPLTLPLLGAVRYEGFFGRLAGHSFPPRPFIYGNKISLKPTPNLELGFSRTDIFAGEGFQPLTFGTFKRAFFSVGDNLKGDTHLTDPGDRRGGFDFSYRIPYLRNWLSLYSDSLVDDDPSPLASPRRSAINPGIYLSHFPGQAKLDFRLEAVNTDVPTSRSLNGNFFYFNLNYHDSHTNKRNIMGDWIGREGKGFQAWSSYWFNPQSSLQIGYRNQKVAKDFIPRGETLNDFSLRANVRLRRDLELNAYLQYERWTAPLLADHRISNVTSAFQLTFWPRDMVKKSMSTDH